MQVPEQAVELGMPVVEVADIGGLEGASLQLEGQHDVAGIERHHVLVQIATAELPAHHQDPFDRLLIAQALQEPLRLITHDKTIALYSDTVILV